MVLRRAGVLKKEHCSVNNQGEESLLVRPPLPPSPKQPSAVIPSRKSDTGLGPNTRIQNSMRRQLSRNGQSPPMGSLSLFLFKVIMICHKRKQLESTMASWCEWTNKGKPRPLLPPSQLSFHHKAGCPSGCRGTNIIVHVLISKLAKNLLLLFCIVTLYSNQSKKYKYCFKQETKNNSKWLKQILSELLYGSRWNWKDRCPHGLCPSCELPFQTPGLCVALAHVTS